MPEAAGESPTDQISPNCRECLKIPGLEDKIAEAQRRLEMFDAMEKPVELESEFEVMRARLIARVSLPQRKIRSLEDLAVECETQGEGGQCGLSNYNSALAKGLL